MWNYFAEIGTNKLVCKECKISLINSGNTSSMMKHLKAKHPYVKLAESGETEDDDTER